MNTKQPVKPDVGASIVNIGMAMSTQDNRCTASPFWLVGHGKFPSIFLTAKGAEKFAKSQGLSESSIIVSSAHSSPEMLALMAHCIDMAGVMDHPQIDNAYLDARRLLRDGV